MGHSDQFLKGCPELSTLAGGYIGFFQNGRLRNWGNIICFISFDQSTWDILMVLVSNVMIFGVKESEYDFQMTIILVTEGYSWNLEVKSIKKLNFQSYFLLSSQISATDGLWKWFLKNHHSYGCIFQGVSHIICYHGLHIGFARWPIMVCVMENAIPHGYIC